MYRPFSFSLHLRLPSSPALFSLHVPRISPPSNYFSFLARIYLAGCIFRLLSPPAPPSSPFSVPSCVESSILHIYDNPNIDNLWFPCDDMGTKKEKRGMGFLTLLVKGKELILFEIRQWLSLLFIKKNVFLFIVQKNHLADTNLLQK